MIDLDETTPPPAAPRRRRRRWLRVLLALLLVTLLGAGAVTGFAIWALGGTASGETVSVEIPQGATGARIAQILQEADVIRSAFVFRVSARFRGVDTGLRPGVYEMRTGLGVDGVIQLLERGVEPEYFRVTIPEGFTVVEIARAVAGNTPISEEDFLEAARSGRHRIDIMPRDTDDLEGLLFPDTYRVQEGMDADDVVGMMLRGFERRTTDLDFRRVRRAHGVSPYEVVVIASMIEREARVQVDRPLISSVIYNRLERPMRLQIDATVQYAILRETGSYKQPLTQEDYTRWRSPWNTYLIDGLPPTPIASPGLASLQAATDPADTGYFYYRLSGDGASHCFAEDFAGHQRCARM